MFRYTAARVALTLPMLLALSVAVFFYVHAVPGHRRHARPRRDTGDDRPHPRRARSGRGVVDTVLAVAHWSAAGRSGRVAHLRPGHHPPVGQPHPGHPAADRRQPLRDPAHRPARRLSRRVAAGLVAGPDPDPGRPGGSVDAGLLAGHRPDPRARRSVRLGAHQRIHALHHRPRGKPALHPPAGGDAGPPPVTVPGTTDPSRDAGAASSRPAPRGCATAPSSSATPCATPSCRS